MSPYEFISDLEKTLNQQKEFISKTKDGGDPVYTEKQLVGNNIDFLLKYVETFKKVLAGCSMDVFGVEYDGTEQGFNGLKCTVTNVENMIIVQLPENIASFEQQEVEEVLRTLQQQGAFGNKAIVVLPYQVKFLRAKITKEGDDQ